MMTDAVPPAGFRAHRWTWPPHLGQHSLHAIGYSSKVFHVADRLTTPVNLRTLSVQSIFGVESRDAPRLENNG